MDIANQPPVRGREIFSAVITPHRSLSQRGFLVLMLAVGTVGFGAGVVFMAMGAWPVFGFFGLDIALIWFAFRANYRAARACELLRLSEEELTVRRISAKGVQSDWSFNPYWVRLGAERDADGEITRLWLISHGKGIEIGYWLSPAEKADFQRALSGALATARTPPAA